jgi:hypothetical protein
MTHVRFALLVTALVTAASLAAPAQTRTATGEATSVDTDRRVLNAPYSAQRRFTSISTGSDGKTNRTESGGSEARDSQGRTYSAGERQWTYQDAGKSVLKSEMLYRIEDPVARTETRWDSTLKVVKVIHFPKGASEGSSLGTGCPAECPRETVDDSFFKVEKLGHKIIEGVEADGERRSYTVPVGQDHNDRPIVVVHETWYCPALKIVILETNNDPQSGQTISQLVNIVRGEPDVSSYRPPADYTVEDVQVSW